jgi:homoserine dehydrogenase
MIEADAVGEIVLTGPGAGSLPTASSVCSDLLDLGKILNHTKIDPAPILGVPSDQLQALPLVPRDEVAGVWYLRLVVEDRPGVMAEITGLLSERGISIESLIQRPPVAGSSQVTVVILTDSVACGRLDAAICDMESLPALSGSVVRLRVESFKEV